MNPDHRPTPSTFSGAPLPHGRRAAPRTTTRTDKRVRPGSRRRLSRGETNSPTINRAGAVRLSPLRRSASARLVIAAVAAGLLIAPYLLPAYADTTSPTGIAPVPATETQSLSMTNSDAAAVAVVRDGYTATKIVPLAYRPYARTANTFVNDPNSPIQWPFTQGVPITSGFGPRIAPCGGCSTFHKGLDLNPGAGTPIQAIADGVVTAANSLGGQLGVHLKIDHLVDGQRVSSLYAHMQQGSVTVAVGDNVTVGQTIGRVGNTGLSTGAHLHFEILLEGTTPVDPYAWLTSKVGS
ncbi:MAG: M23 family metallopeptidase [Cryobacterium sp.]|nr:M23 family metallopeptidase [Micrococcales bacterium]MBX3308945.1 M23 family metallopeptidase [Cryobacterium sp.]